MADSPIGEAPPADVAGAVTDPRPHGPTSEEVDDVIRNELVAVALEQLCQAHRAVLRETVLYRHSVAEAATRLGISPGTVKSRMHYALRALRAALTELGAEGLDGTA